MVRDSGLFRRIWEVYGVIRKDRVFFSEIGVSTYFRAKERWRGERK